MKIKESSKMTFCKEKCIIMLTNRRLSQYGYASDETGIRHAGKIGELNSNFDEAKFMLVACAGFVNYLKGVYTRTNQ